MVLDFTKMITKINKLSDYEKNRVNEAVAKSDDIDSLIVNLFELRNQQYMQKEDQEIFDLFFHNLLQFQQNIP